MASTDTVRDWYRETVLNHSLRGTPGYKPLCRWSISEPVPFPAEGGGTFVEPVHPATTEAWDAFVAVMNFYGETMPSNGGVNSCRNIANSNMPSLHAYLVAVDLPPNRRPSSKFIAAVEEIRTKNGKQVFLNGAIFNDRMHFQLNCSPSDLKTGIEWSTVKGETIMPTPEGIPTAEEIAKAVWLYGHKVDAEGNETAPSAWQYLIRTKARVEVTGKKVAAYAGAVSAGAIASELIRQLAS